MQNIQLKNMELNQKKKEAQKQISTINYIRINNVDLPVCYSLRSRNEHQKCVTVRPVYLLCRSSKSIRGVLFSYGW